jgi:hypothetical protein
LNHLYIAKNEKRIREKLATIIPVYRASLLFISSQYNPINHHTIKIRAGIRATYAK